MGAGGGAGLHTDAEKSERRRWVAQLDVDFVMKGSGSEPQEKRDKCNGWSQNLFSFLIVIFLFINHGPNLFFF